jgi:hypothetical protein
MFDKKNTTVHLSHANAESVNYPSTVEVAFGDDDLSENDLKRTMPELYRAYGTNPFQTQSAFVQREKGDFPIISKAIKWLCKDFFLICNKNLQKKKNYLIEKKIMRHFGSNR